MENIINIAEKIVAEATNNNLIITTAESCTGGLIAAAITDISGSSYVFERGYVTYANSAKKELLGVNEETIKTNGAVSQQTVKEMAEGALDRSKADISIATSGIAGPTGGSKEKPVGLVHFAVSTNTKTTLYNEVFAGNRSEVRKQAVKKSLNMLLEEINNI